MVARAVHGIGAAVLAPGAFSIIGDRTPSDRWGRAMGLTGALIAVAALIGPPAAGILRDLWGANVVFYVDTAFILITLIAFLLITRDASLTPPAEESAQPASQREWRTRKPALWSAYAAAFAITVGIGALVTHLPLMLEEQGETAARSGYSFGIYALVAMLVMASPISRAGDRFGRFGPLMLGLIGVAAGLALLGVLEGLRRSCRRHGRLWAGIRPRLPGSHRPRGRGKRRGSARDGLRRLLRRLLVRSGRRRVR